MTTLSAALAWWKSEGVENLSRFAASVRPDWITEALNASGTATVRHRKLPAEKTIWLVLGIALFGDRSILRVAEDLKVAFNGVIASSALSQARARLTCAPIKWLFERVAQAWSQVGEEKWRGLSLYGMDGSHQRVADCADIAEHFGRPKGRASAGYPQLRFIALMNLTTRLLAGATVGRWTDSEVTLAKDLWAKIPDNSLTIVDRGFLSYLNIFTVLSAGTNCHFLCRAKSNTRLTITSLLADGTALVSLKAPASLRELVGEGTDQIILRALSYRHPGGKDGFLLTSLLDASLYPATEVLALYHKRWELEIAFDEIKTHLLDRREALRSKTVDGTYQEFWAILLLYNLVRREMQSVAEAKGLPASRISFTGAILKIQLFFLLAQNSAPGNLPRELAAVEQDLGKSFVLPPRQHNRRYPRHVKIKMSNYPKNPGRAVSAA